MEIFVKGNIDLKSIFSCSPRLVRFEQIQICVNLMEKVPRGQYYIIEGKILVSMS